MHIGRAKIAPPPLPADLVSRPSLMRVLDRGDDRALTLLCAPPGYGKSLLLADWVRNRGTTPTAWVNVEEDDEDPRRLWATVLSALHACSGVPAESRLRRLVVSRASVELEFLAELVDALDALPTRVCLILDDAHNLVTPEALHGLQMMMCSPRPRLRLVLATRRDPVLPVARLRMEEQLCELRAEHLRFSEDEAALLLERNRIRLRSDQIDVLYDRTGGWPAGIRMAALQLRNSVDADSVITSFSGDERPVADYLVGEVLARLTDDERQVLRCICICDAVPARLAVELSGRQEAAELLDRLEHDTGLVTGIGPDRADYRVQQLLRSYLVADLRRSGRDRIAQLHRRAALWCSGEGRARAAMYHAGQAADGGLMAELLHRWAPELMARGDHHALRRALPPADRNAASGQLATGQPAGDESWRAVISAQRHLIAGDRDRAAADVALARRSTRSNGGVGLAPLLVATERLGWLGDPLHDEPELCDEPERHDPALAAIAGAGRASAHLATGAFGAARREAQLALRSARHLGLGLLELQCLCLVGSAAWAEGDYRAAAAAGLSGVRTAALGGWEQSIWAAGAYAVSAHAALMRGQPKSALPAANDGLRTVGGRDPVVRFALRVARGGAQSDTGDPTGGLLELQQARAELGGVPLPPQLATTAALLEHRSALSSGHLTAAAATASWLSEQRIGQFEQVLMRAWAEAATGVHRTARAVVRPLLAQRPGSVLPTTVIEAELLDATVALGDGDRPAARSALHAALHRAQQLDAVRPFALAEPEVRALLVDQLGDVEDHHTFAYRAFVSGGSSRLSPAVRLSAREREVLEQLPTLRNLDEIADHLAVSVNTVKSHIRAVYGKLGVSSRRTAVLAAHEQNLLG
jgi:LuxR family maltose regulon positive regulatory protein